MSASPSPEKREPLSAFVITFNEADHIAACLCTLSFCDEIVVIDSFSTDRTVEIAADLGARVIQRPWPGYREQKAFGLAATTHEWVLNVDADERVTEELRESILRVLEAEHARRSQAASPVPAEAVVAGYYMNRVVYYLGRWWRRGGWYPEYRLRFFRKGNVTWGGVDPHEKPIVDGPTAHLTGELQHYTYRDMDQQFTRLHSHSSQAALAEFGAGGRVSLVSLSFNPILRMLKFYILKRGYREGMAGFIVAVTEGYYTFMKYAKLWELEYMEKIRNGRGQ